MKATEIQFALNLKALSVPQCRRIVEALFRCSHTQDELSNVCKLSPASIEKHLNILEEGGLVKVRINKGVRKIEIDTSKIQPSIDWFSMLKNNLS